MRRGRFGLWIFLGVWVTGCLGPVPRRGKVRPPSWPPVAGPVKTVPSAPPEPVPPAPGPRDVLEGPVVSVPEKKVQAVGVWVPPVRGDLLSAAVFLSQRPWLRVTALLPERSFGEDENSRRAKSIFQMLVSSHQVEMVLTLPERPVIPLVMDTQNALASVPAVKSLPSPYARPNDVADQIALACEAYRRRWRRSPPGMELPWGVAMGPEFNLISKLKIPWALLPSSGPGASWGEGFSIPVLRPASFPPSKEALERWLQPLLVSSRTVGPVQVNAVEDLAVLTTLCGGTSTVHFALLSEAVEEGALAFLARVPPVPVDFSPWIGDADENRAWELLGVVRRAVDDYQNSGSADLRSLDLAKRGIHSAENGLFFDRFGAEKAVDGEDPLRDFTATLAQVYQILGQPVPPGIRQGAISQESTEAVEEGGGGEFQREGVLLRWRDARNDDRGPGDYFYPTGIQFPTGAWDLLAFEVRPGSDQLTFRFDFATLPNPGRAPAGFSLPLVDLYIDINHSAGAGSQEFLPGRPGIAEPQEAWEYALSVDGWGARFFQAVPGRGIQAMATFPVVKGAENFFSVTVPRRFFRGDPDAWGYAVAVMGRSSSGGPLPVAVDPGPEFFGGALPGREAPPYIDLLVPRGTFQHRLLGVYRGGQDVTLPFVRTE